MTKCVMELKQVISYRDKMLGTSDATSSCMKTKSNQVENEMEQGEKDEELKKQSSTFLALCLSSRRNLCINPVVMSTDSDRDAVDSLCRDRTSSWCVCVCMRETLDLSIYLSIMPLAFTIMLVHTLCLDVFLCVSLLR
jgi:hypothetical protein